ncbi:MAG TPA: sigma-70 family RNA polymerase sigma factor [Solirubrobacteraceae bacterium]
MSPKASTRLLATQSDERLAAMARAGHDRAFEALVQRYRRPLLRYCRRISIPDSRAEDVVQQTLLQAWSALRRGAPVRELRPWLYRIAHNTAVNLARDSARDSSRLALDLDSVSSAEAAVVFEPDLAGSLHLREALTDMAALPHMQREVIFRTALAGHSHEEVATALGISDGAVRGLLYRARATLRTAITAVTPPPLIAWISGPGQGVVAEHVGELAAGGGLGVGLLAKGALAVLAAGTIITGAVIVHYPPIAHTHTHSARPGAQREIASLTASSDGLASHRGAPFANAVRLPSAAPSSTAPRSAARGSVRLRIAVPGPSGSLRGPSVAPRHSSATTPKGTAPTNTTVHVPAPSGTSSPSSGANSSAPSGGSSGSGGGSSGGGSTGGGSTGGGSSGSGSGGSGSGSGGSGSGGGGSGSGGSGSGGGGSTGSGSGGGSSGGGGLTGGGSGGSGTGAESEGSPQPPSGGSGPVTTVVNEVTGLLEHTVHGFLGH